MLRRIVETTLCVTALGSLVGCMEDGRYPFRDVPACASDTAAAPPVFSAPTYAIVKDARAAGIYRLGDASKRSALRGLSSSATLAIITCQGELVPGASSTLLEKFDAYYIPPLCEGQKTLFHAPVSAQQDRQSEKMGYAGYYQFPPVELSCASGTLVRSDDHTLGQRLDGFYEHVSRFARTHAGRYPDSLEELSEATGHEAVILDAWKTPLEYVSEPRTAKLISYGPDKRKGTRDDVEVFTISHNGGVDHILTYPGTGYVPTGSWATFSGK